MPALEALVSKAAWESFSLEDDISDYRRFPGLQFAKC